ncbi:MAG: lipopolysaccharide kinase InaA family protein [Gammaproteobacteria bacterium]|nr:lipopolysaccharide kinase InaA family protein [Gammaproteobacteria bacterium]
MTDIIQQSWRRLLICNQQYFSEKMQEFFANPDFFLENTKLPFYKSIAGDTTTVAVVAIDNKKFVVKRYNTKSIWHSIKKLLRQSRAMRSWQNSHYLISKNIPTPKPVAVLIKRFGPWRKETYFISEFLPSIRGNDFFIDKTKTPEEWKRVIQNIQTLITKLEQALITHKDFQHRNLLMLDNVPYLLDLDHMRKHRYKSFWFRLNFRKDLEHFVKLLEINPEAQQMFANVFLNEV